MKIDKTTITIMLLAVGFLGTLWNYIRLRLALGRFWKLNDPSISKSEIRSILNTMIEASEVDEKLKELKEVQDEVNKITESYDSRIKMTLKSYLKSTKIFVSVLGNIYEIADPKVKELMDNELEKVQEAADGYNESQVLWPELFILGAEGEIEDDEDDEE